MSASYLFKTQGAKGPVHDFVLFKHTFTTYFFRYSTLEYLSAYYSSPANKPEQVSMDIPLADVLQALREELNKAEIGKNPNKPLIIDEAEVEITMVVTKNVTANVEGEAKVEFKVLDYLKVGDASAKLNAEGQWEKASTQKLRLKLSAAEKDKDGQWKKRTLSN